MQWHIEARARDRTLVTLTRDGAVITLDVMICGYGETGALWRIDGLIVGSVRAAHC